MHGSSSKRGDAGRIVPVGWPGVLPICLSNFPKKGGGLLGLAVT